MRRWPSLFALVPIGLFAVAAPLLGCGPPPARTATTSRSLDERRALEVIRRAVSADGQRPSAGRTVQLPGGKSILVDVSIEGHAYGIAYITQEDAKKLADGIPPRNGEDERLRLIRAGEDGQIRVVLLYQENYRFDDLEGEAHEQTTISCEAQLTRDVRDFLTHARTKKFE